MTISSTTSKVQFNGNGATLEFPFTFKVFVAADVRVVLGLIADGTETDQTLNVDYTVALNADQNNSPGGTVTMTTAPATGYRLSLLRALDATQETDITTGGGFYPEVIENALDRLTMLVQQNSEAIDRAATVSITDSTAYTTNEIIAATRDYAAASAASAVDSANSAALAAGYVNLALITDYGDLTASTAIYDYGSL